MKRFHNYYFINISVFIVLYLYYSVAALSAHRVSFFIYLVHLLLTTQARALLPSIGRSSFRNEQSIDRRTSIPHRIWRIMAGPFSRVSKSTPPEPEEDEGFEIKVEDFVQPNPRHGRYVCAECGKIFLQASKLGKHFMDMHMEDAAFCPRCSYGNPCPRHEYYFDWRAPKARRKCPCCHATFDQRSDFRKHYKRHNRKPNDAKKKWESLPQHTRDELANQQQALFRQARDRAITNGTITSTSSTASTTLDDMIKVVEDGRVHLLTRVGCHSRSETSYEPIGASVGAQSSGGVPVSRDHRMDIGFVVQDKQRTSI